MRALVRGPRAIDPAEARALVEEFADFMKICTVYPPSNARVQTSVATFLARVTKMRGKRGRLRIRLVGDKLAVNHVVTETQKPNVEWLVQCMADTALGGVAITMEATSESLLELSALLRKNLGGKRTARKFEDLWDHELAGVQLLERMFGFGGDTWEKLSSETRAVLDGESPRGDVLRELIEGEYDSLETVTDLLREATTEEGSEFVDGVELLRALVETLPDDVIGDSVTSLAIISKAVQAFGEAIVAASQQQAEASENDYRKLLLEVSSRFFFRAGDKRTRREESAQTQAGPKGHAGDDEFDDDLEQFEQEFSSLPDGCDPAREITAAKTLDEALSIALHQFGKLESEHDAVGIERVLKELLAKAGDPAFEILRIYLADFCKPRGVNEPWLHVSLLAGVLERTGLLDHMIRFRVLTPEVVAATFPRMFGAYVDSLGNDVGDRRLLVQTLSLVKPSRVLAADNLLDPHAGVLARSRLDKICATKSHHALPFVRSSIASSHDRVAREDLACLIGLVSECPEATALTVIGDQRALTRSYLLALCEFEMSGKDSDNELRRTSESLVRDFIVDPPPNVHVLRRVRAVGALSAFWSAPVESFVKKLLRASGFLRRRKLPKPVREALKSLLQTRAR